MVDSPVRSRTPQVDPAAKKVAWSLIAGLIAPILDTTIVTIALEQLANDLGTSVAVIQWVSTGYLLALAVAVPVAGWAAIRFGARAAWTTGIVIFLLGSILCACAWDAPSLIAFRVLQGLGAGLILPLMTSILVTASRGVGVGQLIAMVSMPTALGPILGPVLGGVILHWADWRWLFLVNVPLSVIALIAARAIPSERADATAPLDWVGLALIVPGLALLLYGLSNAHNGIGRVEVVVPVVLGAMAMAAFIIRGSRSEPAPHGDGRPRPMRRLIDVRVLARRAVAASSVGLFFFGVASYGVMLLLPLFFQQIRGDSVLAAALTLIPQGVGALLTRSLAGRLTDRIGGRWVAVVGFGLVACATWPFAVANAHTDVAWLMAVLFVRGLGLGLLLSPVMAAAFYGLPGGLRNDASMATRIIQQIGGSFGTAVLAVVLTASAGLVGGFHAAFWWAVALAVLGGVGALALPSSPDASSP